MLSIVTLSKPYKKMQMLELCGSPVDPVIRSLTSWRETVPLAIFMVNTPASPTMAACCDEELLIIDIAISHSTVWGKVNVPPYCSITVLVDPEGSTTVHVEGEYEHNVDFEIR